MTWREQALCADMGAWWFRTRPPHKTAAARAYDDDRRRICAACPVVGECRTEARNLMEPSGVWGGETPDERCKRLDKTHGPVARCCAWCGDLFTPHGAGSQQRKTCSDTCGRLYKNARQGRDAAQKRANSPSTSRPCPRCGETQNMASGQCMGWVCAKARKVESRAS